MADNEIDKFMEDQRAQMKTEPAPSVTLPASFDDPNLKPRFSNTPEKQLNEYKIRLAAKDAGFDPHVAAAVGLQESGFNPDAVSPTGVRGLMQVSGVAAKDLGLDPSQVRNNPDMNIKAGVQYLAKHGLAKYPDPAVRDSYVKSVMNQAEKSRASTHDDKFSSIEDEINAAKDPTGVSPAEVVPSNKPATAAASEASPQKSGLALSKSYLDSVGLGFLERQIGKSKDARDLSEYLNNLITPGANKSFDQMAADKQATIQDAQKSDPLASGVGKVAGIAAQTALLNPAFKAAGAALGAAPVVGDAIAQSPKLAKLAGVAAQGGAGAGVYEGTTNPSATPKSVLKAGEIGAATAGLFHGASTAATSLGKKFSQVLVNYATKTGDPEIADYISNKLGASLSKASLLTKNQSVLDDTEEQLQSHLKDLDAQGKTVDMRKIAQDPALLKDAESLDNVEQRAQASSILNKLAKYEQKGEVSLSEANDFKRDLYEQSNFNNQSNKPTLASFQKKVSLAVKNGIEDASGSEKVAELNKTLSHGINLKDALIKKPGIGRQVAEAGRTAGEVAAVLHSHGAALPGILAERAATSIPGSTALGAVANGAAKASDAVSPDLAKFLGVIMPQLFK